MAQYKLVVLSNAKDGRDDEYNDWYNNTHLDDVLKLPGFYQAQRMVVDKDLTGATPTHKYLAIYNFESDNLDATIQIFLETGGTEKMPISDSLSPDASPLVYRVLGPLKRHG